MSAACLIKGCDRPQETRCLCNLHYQRVLRGQPLDGVVRQRRPIGNALRFLNRAVASKTDDCILWPYQESPTGRPRMHFRGKSVNTARAVCILAHGEPAGDKNEAAHLCGNRLCVNPRHIRWATRRENEEDKLAHGTRLRGSDLTQAKLTEDQVLTIRAQLAERSQSSLAREYGVTQSAIWAISSRRVWAWLP